jgi:hypothetical protein
MKDLAPWLARAVFSAAYWFAALYLAMGLFFGDRVTDNGIVGPIVMMPLWLFVVLALAVYAVCSVVWDRVVQHSRKVDR